MCSFAFPLRLFMGNPVRVLFCLTLEEVFLQLTSGDASHAAPAEPEVEVETEPENTEASEPEEAETKEDAEK